MKNARVNKRLHLVLKVKQCQKKKKNLTKEGEIILSEDLILKDTVKIL